MPEVLEVRVEVDVRELDQGHVVLNVTPVNWRGIWFFQGHDMDVR